MLSSSSSSSSSSNVVQPQTTFTTGAGNAIWTVDISNNLVAGAGSDKTCRIWSLEDDKQHFRMVHHLVGHAQKITSIRFLGDAMSQNGIVTAGVDRQLKVWDISRQTYRDLSTIHLPSTANSIDVAGTAGAADSSMILGSGHADGGLRFWDLRSSQRTAEFKRTWKYEILYHLRFLEVLISGLSLSQICMKALLRRYSFIL